MQPLPVDSVLPGIRAALRSGGAVVVEAPPGAGKTTRVPRALLEESGPGDGEVLVLEPRRLAARLAARRVAEELGDAVGGIAGYQVRFEDATGPRTRLRFVTEGIFTRRLVSAPELPGVDAVVLDEFHERRLQGDLALAAVRRLRETARPDLKVVVMSATLEAGRIADFLGAPIVRCEGRLFDVAVDYLSLAEAAEPGVRLETRVARAVRRLAAEGPDGHILCFLPGMAEIRGAMRACEEIAARSGLDLLPLHGDLSPDEQDRAVRTGPRRKVIFATNVAETSVTVDGVAAVVDSGLARVASRSAWSGLPLLAVRRISRASAAQRAGRAGRTRPGRALRLYTRQDHDARPAFDSPEILREDLAEIVLAAAAVSEAALDWLDPPPEAAVGKAMALLRLLGAVDGGGGATGLGLRMLRYPLHPRLSRFLVEADSRGEPGDGALVAALLAERDIRERTEGPAAPRESPTGRSDLADLARLFRAAERARFAPDRVRALGLSPPAVSAVDRGRRQLLALMGRGISRGAGEREEVLLRAALAAFPDRVGRRRSPGARDIVLAGGGAARLDPASSVRDAALIVAVDAEERRGEGRPTRAAGGVPAGDVTVRLASAVTPGMLADAFPERLRREDALVWNTEAERVEAWDRLVFDGLTIEERRRTEVDTDKASALLTDAAAARGAEAFVADGALARLRARLEFAARAAPEAGIRQLRGEEIDAALRESCAGRRSFRELRDADVMGAILRLVPGGKRAALDRIAPERIALPGGRSARVQYEEGGKTPYIACRLQDLFGLGQGPSVADGRVRLQLHLLGPNMRAVQVTADLAGFWERHYPAVRRDMMRRYPRHAWPEDPRSASPRSATGRTRGR